MFWSKKPCNACDVSSQHYKTVSLMYQDRIADLKAQIAFLEKQLTPIEHITPAQEAEANFIFAGAGEAAPDMQYNGPQEQTIDDKELMEAVGIQQQGNMQYHPLHARNRA